MRQETGWRRCRGGVLGGHRDWRPRGDDDVDLEPDQLGREVGQPVESTLCKSILDGKILALNPPELAEPLPERLNEISAVGRAAREITYPVDLSRRLRPGGERRGNEAQTHHAEEGSSVHY